MSALGQKRTCAVQKVMSALPPKADINCDVSVDWRSGVLASVDWSQLFCIVCACKVLISVQGAHP